MHLVIKNIGPIKEVDIELNKINVFIGPQSCGKSTINKIACYLSWVEKKVSLDQSFDFFYEEAAFRNNLEAFHNMVGYLRDDSCIIYESNVLSIVYEEKVSIPKFSWKDRFAYIRPTVSYIPAERNIVSILSNVTDARLPDNNIKYYINDWTKARETHKDESPLFIESLKVSYQLNESNKRDIDYIKISEKENKKLELPYTSSGIQSLVPLYVLLDYFQKNIGKDLTNLSVDENNRIKKLEKILELNVRSQFTKEELKYIDEYDFSSFISKHELFLEYVRNSDMLKKLVENKEESDRIFQKLYEDFEKNKSCFGAEVEQNKAKYDAQFHRLKRNYTKNNYLKIFLEEPEMNAFPSTQGQVMFDLLEITKANNENRLMITTHSPYILYALNNCMLGAQIAGNVAKDDINEFSSVRGWIDPQKVSVWQIKEGKLENIKDQDLQIIGSHYFSNILGLTMNEYNRMLKYFTKKNEN